MLLSINDQKSKKNAIAEIERDIDDLDQTIAKNPNDNELMEQRVIMKKQYDTLCLEKVKGAQIRSRLHWAEKGEKNTSFFLNLENSRQTANTIYKIKTKDGEIVHDNRDILNVTENYYDTLYNSTKPTTKNIKDYLNKIDIPKLNAEEEIICEGEITTDECDQVIKELKLNKSPGLDGLPGEFYKTLWPYFGKYLVGVFNECFDNDEVSHSQKQSVIRLIFKKRNKEELKNYRPINFKIIAFTLANRLQNVIGKIISPDQTAYINNLFIGQNIRLVSDVIEFSNEKNLDGVLLSLDYEKAFDTAEHKFIFECLQLYNFGPDFIKWIKTLYTKSEIYIKNNGYLSGNIHPSRGVKQGCPISAMLFILIVETLAISIRKTKT